MLLDCRVADKNAFSVRNILGSHNEMHFTNGTPMNKYNEPQLSLNPTEILNATGIKVILLVTIHQ